jgi:hydroxymethylpyrimidine/phosphomethylpyrimidine kinase
MPRAVKLGMLTSKPTIEMLSGYLSGQMPQHQGGPFLVLDPVMISTSGHHLVPPEAVAAIRDELLPHVDWVTPNIPEALALARRESEVSSLEDMLTLAAELSESFEVQTTLLKGGHFSAKREEVLELQARKSITLPLSQGSSRTLEIAVEWEEWDDEGEGAEVLATYCASIDAPRSPDLVVDMLVRRKGDTIQLFVGRKIDTSSTHGTGCTLSSALACALAQTPAPIGSDSMERDTAVARKAINYVRSAISGAYPLGKGHGPLNHAVLTAPRPLPSYVTCHVPRAARPLMLAFSDPRPRTHIRS